MPERYLPEGWFSEFQTHVYRHPARRIQWRQLHPDIQAGARVGDIVRLQDDDTGEWVELRVVDTIGKPVTSADYFSAQK